MIGDVQSIAGFGPVTVVAWFTALGAVLFAAGLGRAVTARDRLAQIIGFNVVGLGSLLILVAVGARGGAPDPSLTALAITGLVITVAFTGVGVALVRAIESDANDDTADEGEQR
ncbi:NADH-quinone oxidoreductase subunit K [Corynebacterium sp. NPDC060344]|uniref:NADH-quinone oxidoreductase subunit K n=1 Tax=Corynebacterium sp. NPDC060344 TaxID=3347101 RepID=UPI00364B144D